MSVSVTARTPGMRTPSTPGTARVVWSAAASEATPADSTVPSAAKGRVLNLTATTPSSTMTGAADSGSPIIPISPSRMYDGRQCSACLKAMTVADRHDKTTLAKMLLQVEDRLSQSRKERAALKREMTTMDRTIEDLKASLAQEKEKNAALVELLGNSMTQVMTLDAMSEAAAKKLSKQDQEAFIYTESPRRAKRHMDRVRSAMSETRAYSVSAHDVKAALYSALDETQRVVQRVIEQTHDRDAEIQIRAEVLESGAKSATSEVQNLQRELFRMKQTVQLCRQDSSDKGQQVSKLQETIDHLKVEHREAYTKYLGELEMHSDTVAEILADLHGDVQKQFGYVPVHMTNKMQRVVAMLKQEQGSLELLKVMRSTRRGATVPF